MAIDQSTTVVEGAVCGADQRMQLWSQVLDLGHRSVAVASASET